MKKNPVQFVFLYCLFAFTLQAQETEFSIYEVLNLHQDAATLIAEHTDVRNLVDFNTEHLDYSPIRYKDGIVFTSTRKQHKQWWKNLFKKEYASLFYAVQRGDGTFQPPRPLKGAINGKLNEGAATFSPDGKLMIFTRNSSTKNNKGYYDLKLFAADYDHGQWINVRELPFNSDLYTNAHPSLSADGQTLYFASNRPGGFGGMDIYASTWTDNRWGQPVNLGETVNSKTHELFPSIHTDGSLFFSSSDQVANGDLDLFVSKQLGKNWSAKQNLGAPFNSPMDDFGIVINPNGRSGFLTSNRNNGIGGDDIYAWTIDEWPLTPDVNLLSQITIKDAQSQQLLDDTKVKIIELNINIDQKAEQKNAFTISNKIDDQLIDLIGQTIQPIKGENGANWYALQPEKNYLVIAEQDQYNPFQQLMAYEVLANNYTIALEAKASTDPATAISYHEKPLGPVAPKMEMKIENPLIAATVLVKKSAAPSRITIPLAVEETLSSMYHTGAVKDNTTVQLNNIYYGLNEFAVNPLSQSSLNELVDLLQNQPTMEIRILSHTDARGKASYNQKLSQRRADAVRDFLIQKGIDGQRLTASGLGEGQLLNHCKNQESCNESQHQENRRTEFEIVKR